MFEHLKVILPILKHTFETAYLSVPKRVMINCPTNIDWLQKDEFFKLHFLLNDPPVWEHFHSLFEFAAFSCQPEQTVHLCFIDRLAFVLQSIYREQFLIDVKSVKPEHTPLIFHRSPKAWRTYPRNYHEVEKFITSIGELVLGKTLDFAWCHFVVQAVWLRRIISQVQNSDMSMMADLILLCKGNINTQDVDWLEWEDPFFSTYEASQLKQLREDSLEETQKRLSYAIPMVQRIIERTSQRERV